MNLFFIGSIILNVILSLILIIVISKNKVKVKEKNEKIVRFISSLKIDIKKFEQEIGVEGRDI